MPDTATNSLHDILNSGEYEVFDGIPIFDVHKEWDAKGNLVRDFNPASLQQIADLNNRRRATGDMGMTGPGHTTPPQKNAAGVIIKAKETDQPPGWGFLGELKVAPFGPDQKIGLLARLYMKKRIELPDGRVISARQALADFPRRSVELWPEGLIDWLALLRVTPQRDLGLTTSAVASQYQRAVQIAPWETLKERLYLDKSCGRPAHAAFSLDGKLRYSMEASMPLPNDPVAPPDANANAAPPEAPKHDLNPEEMTQADRVAAYFKSGACKHYAAGEGAGMPGPGNTFIPGAVGADKDKLPSQFARPGAPAQSALDKEARELSLQAELEKERRLRRYEKHLRTLRDDDRIELDVDEELAEVARQNLDDVGFNHFCKRLFHYAKSPDGGKLVITRDLATKKEASLSEANKAKNLASAKGISFNAALADIRGAA